jgi:hypothetical protein
MSEPSRDERMDLIRRISASSAFTRSDRLRAFLVFITEQYFTRPEIRLTEHDIGCRVFGRKDGYLPLEDSVVRTAARRLRSKLRDYFDEEGREESWRVDVPKGSYVPVFTQRESPGTRPPSLISAFIDESSQGLLVVSSDSSLVLMSSLAQRTISPEEYSSREFALPSTGLFKDERLADFWRDLAVTRYTSYADLAVIQSVLKAAGSHAGRVVIRHSRDISSRDLHVSRTILIGGLVANPWTALYEQSCNFRVRAHFAPNKFGFRAELVNCNPLPGEPAAFSCPKSSTKTGPWHARLTLLPSLSGEGRVLLIAGLNAAAAEAAGEFAGDPEAAVELMKLLDAKQLKKLPPFEAVLETKVVDSVPERARIVAFRRGFQG